MTPRLRFAAPALCILAGLSAALGIGLALDPAPASAWPEVRGSTHGGHPHHVRRHRRAGRDHVRRDDIRRGPPPPTFPRAEIVTGYLPRNTNVPLYNEPPRREPRW